MQQNKFKIVIPSYNNEKWIEPNLASIIHQNYTNFEVLYIDDASTDDTYEIVQHVVHDLPNWKVIRNEKNMRRGYNISPHSEHIKNFFTDDEDILVFVDGDDWLYDDNVLGKLNDFYNDGDYWMGYGGMVCYPSGQPGNPQNSPYPDVVHQANAYRRDHWRASHLRTFKWHLYKQIRKEDMCYSKTGEYYFHAEDLATSYPCLEMCPKDKIGVLDFYSYVFNETPSNRERGIAREAEAGMDLENEIRNQKPYDKLK
jgi:glycosyltransferase involved in cell wall biosynthesis